jgi:TATA-box binding protein (TBP) (component of TFIID and TFIIIB)
MNIEKIFDNNVLPITDYTFVQKKRGRKRKQVVEDPNKEVASGSIIMVQYRDQFRGAKLKKTTSFFRNSMPVVMKVQDKLISFKVSSKGKFQITGCRTNEQAEICVVQFYIAIKEHTDLYSFTYDKKNLKICFEPVMYNVDFSLGFQVNREKLDIYVNTKTNYTSLLETTIGYTGVNIKMLVPESKLRDIKIECKEYLLDGTLHQTEMSYDSFYQTFKTKKKKPIYNTFLVFQSGSVIMSGKTLSCMEGAYNEFIQIILQCFQENF